MLGFFRRIINSKVGIIVTLVTLGVIALAFAAGDVTGLRNSASGLTGNNVAKVDGVGIGTAELTRRAQDELDAARQQQPSADMAQFVAQGGLEAALDRMVNALSLERFGIGEGMSVSKRSVDGQLASIPALQGPNGKFDQTAYQRLLADRRLTDAGVRTDIARQIYAEQLTAPIVAAGQVPDQLALPYASLLLEKRFGQVGLIPDGAGAPVAAPTTAEVQQFYARNTQRYAVPERRVIRFAEVTPETVKARAAPTEAEIAAAYKADPARFAAAEKRTIEQVIALDQGTANTIATRAKAGGSLADAARAAGLDASTQTAVTKAAYATATAPAVADAVFAGARGTVVGPVRSPLGWTVARVTAVQQAAGRSLDQARAELSAEIAKRKTTEVLSSLNEAMNDALTRNATFDEVVGDQKLTAQTSPALTANGTDPDNPAFKAGPTLAPVIQAAFGAEEGDEPQLVPTGQDGSFALVALGRVVHAAPRPLAQIQAQVARDFAADRAHRAARTQALALLARVNGGAPFAQALAAAHLPAPRPATASRAQLAANPRAAPPALVLMFSMAQGTTKLLEQPGGGWMLVHLDRVQAGNAAGNPAVVAAARADLARNTGGEYALQFARAVRGAVGAKIDPAAVARVKANLLGANGAGGN